MNGKMPDRPLNMKLLWPCTLRLSLFSAILFCAVTGVGISSQVKRSNGAVEEGGDKTRTA